MGFATGIQPTNTFTAADVLAGKTGGLGEVVETHDGKAFVFLKSTAAITAQDAVTYDETYAAVVAPISTSNDAGGDRVAVANVAVTSGDYFWGQIYGPTTVRVLASAAANVRLNTTATAGVLDDDGTAGAFAIEGLILTTANGGSTAAAACLLDYPRQRVPVL